MSQSEAILLVLTAHNVLGDTGRSTGFNVHEAAYPWRVFTEAGYRVDFVAPGQGTPSPDSAERADPVQRAFLDDAEAAAGVREPLRPQDVDPDAYAAIFYVGGHGVMWDFPGDRSLAGVAESIYGAGGVVAAVCHGPAGLVDLALPDGKPLVAGKNLAAFTNSEEAAIGLTDVVPFLLESKLVELGAKHSGAALWEPHVVTDGRLVTGQNPASAEGTAATVLKVLGK